MQSSYSYEEDILDETLEDEEATPEIIIPIVKDCYYYYGIHAEEFKNKNYVDAIKCKIKAANKLKAQMLEDGVMNCDQYKLNDVIEAIKFNKRLLREIDPRVII